VPIPQHLLILADKKSGNIILNNLEVFESERPIKSSEESSIQEGMEFTKFLVKV
jgi:hypothetical protein